MSVIKWQHNGRQIFLPIAILRPNAATDITFAQVTALVDTGATTSGISWSAVNQLGSVSHTKKLLRSAHGEDHVPYFIFRIGLFPGVPASDRAQAPLFPFIFPESEGFACTSGSECQAILGMDILRQCDLSIDRNGCCVLAFG